VVRSENNWDFTLYTLWLPLYTICNIRTVMMMMMMMMMMIMMMMMMIIIIIIIIINSACGM